MDFEQWREAKINEAFDVALARLVSEDRTGEIEEGLRAEADVRDALKGESV